MLNKRDDTRNIRDNYTTIGPSDQDSNLTNFGIF